MKLAWLTGSVIFLVYVFFVLWALYCPSPLSQRKSFIGKKQSCPFKSMNWSQNNYLRHGFSVALIVKGITKITADSFHLIILKSDLLKCRIFNGYLAFLILYAICIHNLLYDINHSPSKNVYQTFISYTQIITKIKMKYRIYFFSKLKLQFIMLFSYSDKNLNIYLKGLRRANRCWSRKSYFVHNYHFSKDPILHTTCVSDCIRTELSSPSP